MNARLELKDGVSTSVPLSKSESPTSPWSLTWAPDLLWVQTPASYPTKFFLFKGHLTICSDIFITTTQGPQPGQENCYICTIKLYLHGSLLAANSHCVCKNGWTERRTRLCEMQVDIPWLALRLVVHQSFWRLHELISFNSENGRRAFLRNFGANLQYYTLSNPVVCIRNTLRCKMTWYL